MSGRGLLLVAALLWAGAADAAPRSAGIKDPDTRAWFQITEALSGDAMEGRDIGSPGYDRAAAIVAAKFKAAGLKPAGDDGTWFQTFPVHESRVEKDGTSFEVVRENGARAPLRFLQDITVRATDQLPATVDAPLDFRGYCGPQQVADVPNPYDTSKGKVVVCFNTKRAGMPSAADRIRTAAAAGAVALIEVDDPYFTIEPPRWPAAYARSVTIKGSPAPAAPAMPVMSVSAEAFQAMVGRDVSLLLKAGGAKEDLPNFQFDGRFRATFKVTTRDYTAKNVLALLPGRDAGLKAQTLVLSAHLDGYGYGEPVNGDGLYNGALDDAAYVATLIRFADKHRGQPLRRSVLFAAFTGEEKGLLGAHWFVDHPTVPKASLAADINLDQLRPLFPLKILTELAVDTTTLGTTAKAVAASMHIRIQPDPEPERGLLQRADHYPFLQAGVPATGFIFGYEPGTEAERRYREWYQVRYHRPQDDLTQPMDFQAAGDFNRFFYKLAETVADADARPAFIEKSGTVH